MDLFRAFFQKADDAIAAPTPAGAGLPPALAPSVLPQSPPMDAIPQIRLHDSKKTTEPK
jgi:hypothetical protein